MKNIDRKELASLRKEVNDEIREIKASIKDEEKRDEFSRKVDRLYDRLEGNELLLGAVDMVLSEIKNKKLRDDQLQNIIEEFKDAVDFAERNGASFSSRDILDRVLVSNTNESFKSRRKRIKESRVLDSYSSRWEEALESFKHRRTHHSVENKQIRFKKEAKGKFIRTINPTPTGREKTVTLNDLDVNPNVEYIGLFVNGNDIGGLDGVSWTKPMWDQLEPLMKKLDDELLKIKGEPNKKIEADIYLCDEDDNNEVTVEIPTIETDRFGHIVFDDSKGYPRKVKTLEDLCLIAFHKMLKNM